ncbi:unnamed protein product [Chondrus crispus]|uniref:Uncharacterized protein n=1 Tax=Chondrus crispus TaxID=2769 RepID=R7Q608_CHOCR|nr:unnamed protein product [Chondrus crispus]CDF32900.1 unnamed protein product [Chondrus crispus]|eukprot:XP_005712701.1 unnamed protein product [Chondrus crispus]
MSTDPKTTIPRAPQTAKTTLYKLTGPHRRRRCRLPVALACRACCKKMARSTLLLAADF